MTLSEKIAAEAAAERERIGYDPRRVDRYGNIALNTALPPLNPSESPGHPDFVSPAVARVLEVW